MGWIVTLSLLALIAAFLLLILVSPCKLITTTGSSFRVHRLAIFRLSNIRLAVAASARWLWLTESESDSQSESDSEWLSESLWLSRVSVDCSHIIMIIIIVSTVKTQAWDQGWLTLKTAHYQLFQNTLRACAAVHTLAPTKAHALVWAISHLPW